MVFINDMSLEEHLSKKQREVLKKHRANKKLNKSELEIMCGILLCPELKGEQKNCFINFIVKFH